MAQSARPTLANALVVLCEDAFFAVSAARRLDTDLMRGLARRRATLVAGLGPDMRGGLMNSWEGWVTSLCAAIAPLAPPRWMPLADAVEQGLSLEHGARGVRSLFTSKPSEKEVLRVRTIGSLAVRVLAAVMGATGQFSGESSLIRAAAVASLGLPEEDQRMLNTETPILADALEVYGDVEPKLARAIIKGAFQAAMSDGLDPREEDAVLKLSTKLNVSVEAVNEARNQAKQTIEQGKTLGEASVDAIRYVLFDDNAEAEKYGIAAARLNLATIHRKDSITAINVGGTVNLGKKYSLERKEREAALGLAWAAVLSADPTFARRSELMLRHDRLAADFGDKDSGAAARDAVERHVDSELSQIAGLREGSGSST
ncbi:MAG: hypothetical protein IPK82_40595 [Polyangiaceae bacterium]|nr:hypothetical protein [Polyangiaceae bacterium]